MLPVLRVLPFVLVSSFCACSESPNSSSSSTRSDAASAGVDGEGAIADLQKFIAAHKTADATGKSTDTTRAGWKTRLPKPPKVEFATDKQYIWKLETNLGPIEVKLMPDVAPMHVSSTIYLTLLGFYDGLSFHRVIRQFMAQGGDPLGDGTGGPGYEYDCEFKPGVGHDRPYLLSMANAGPGTDGSQFFLTFVPTPGLNGKHTIFGEVLDEVSRKTVRAMEDRGNPSDGPPLEPMLIQKASIEVR